MAYPAVPQLAADSLYTPLSFESNLLFFGRINFSMNFAIWSKLSRYNNHFDALKSFSDFQYELINLL